MIQCQHFQRVWNIALLKNMIDVFLLPGASFGDLGFSGLSLSVRQHQLVKMLAQSKASQDTGRNNHMEVLSQPKKCFQASRGCYPY